MVKNGKYGEKQHYKCKTCGKTFSDFTDTPLSMSHFISKWPIFIKTMIEGISLRKAEKIVGVSFVNIFYWMHKILNIIKFEESLETVIMVNTNSIDWIKVYNEP